MKLESDSDSEEPWELSFMGDDLDALTHFSPYRTSEFWHPAGIHQLRHSL